MKLHEIKKLPSADDLPVVRPKFIKDLADSAKIDIEVDGKVVGHIRTDSKEGYNVRLGVKGRGWVRTLAAAKKWAEAVLNNDKSKLPPGSRWPS